MPNWGSLDELERDSGIFIKLMHGLFGLYVWEWFVTIEFDTDFITGRKKFKWPMIFYFANRYLLLFALIGILIALDTTTEVNCQALYTFNQLAGDAAVGLASINLSLRTIAVYANSKYIIGLLVLVILGHWSLILQGTLLTATWEPTLNTCVILKTDNKILAATFIYSMAFDLLVLTLNIYKLAFVRRSDGAMGASRIGKLIFGDGLAYFFIAFAANLLATVFMVLNLNSIMNVIFNVPAAIASTIVACRVVRRLSNFTNQGPEVFTASHSQSGHQFRGVNHSTSRPQVTRANTTGGVHVQMETFSRQEDTPVTPVQIEYLRYSSHGMEERKKDGSDTDIDLEYGDVETKGAAL